MPTLYCVAQPKVCEKPAVPLLEYVTFGSSADAGPAVAPRAAAAAAMTASVARVLRIGCSSRPRLDGRGGCGNGGMIAAWAERFLIPEGGLATPSASMRVVLGRPPRASRAGR